MTKHRAGPARRQRARDDYRHRAEVRPRYGRIVTMVASLAVLVIAVVGGAGLLPTAGDDADPAAAIDRSGDDGNQDVGGKGQVNQPSIADTDTDTESDQRDEPAEKDVLTDTEDTDDTEDTSLPAGSGGGLRVVYSESRQRVWLVDEADKVQRTYPVSGSIYDNLDPGTFEVYSRSENAVGIDDSGTMKYFVRFTTGDEGAAIGFHDIPVDEGRRVQTVAELGTPLSHGCIRQAREDAIALWEFAPIGTTVVVTA